MAINYKEEVDSGFDRKLMVEHVIYELIKRGIPAEEIENDPNFIKFRHSELLKNISRGYASKLEQLEDLYGGFYEVPKDGLGEDYSELYHGMKELYPMTSQEQKEMFTKRIKLLKEIEDDQKKYEKKLIKDRDILINKISKFKIKHGVIDKLIDLTSELDELQEQGKIDGSTMDNLFKKYRLDKNNYCILNSIYREFMELNTKLEIVSENIVNVRKGVLYSPEYEFKKMELEKITEEIISRNIKLINGFIRRKYNNLLVEQSELFSICLEGLYKAIKEYDPNRGMFSTFAEVCMNTKIHHEFKNLTGYSWEDYWRKQKITKLIEVVSEMLGRTATVIDLVELGLIDLSYETAYNIQQLPVFLLESYVYGEPEPNEQLSDPQYDSYLVQDEWEDKKYSNSYVDDEEYTSIAISNTLPDVIEKVIYTLRDRLRIILVLRYGLDPYKYLYDHEREYFDQSILFVPHTQKEVGAFLHISDTRVYQLEKKALRILRSPNRLNKMEDCGIKM